MDEDMHLYKNYGALTTIGYLLCKYNAIKEVCPL